MRIIGGYQDTRNNNEDLAITPYLLGVLYWGDIKVIGVGLCWIYSSVYIGIGLNVPKNYPTFKILKRKNG